MTEIEYLHSENKELKELQISLVKENKQLWNLVIDAEGIMSYSDPSDTHTSKLFQRWLEKKIALKKNW